MLSLEWTSMAWHDVAQHSFFCNCIIIINDATFLAYKIDGRLHVYFKRKERDEESQGKMQETGQLEMGGSNIITSLLFFAGAWGQHCLVSIALGA